MHLSSTHCTIMAAWHPRPWRPCKKHMHGGNFKQCAMSFTLAPARGSDWPIPAHVMQKHAPPVSHTGRAFAESALRASWHEMQVEGTTSVTLALRLQNCMSGSCHKVHFNTLSNHDEQTTHTSVHAEQPRYVPVPWITLHMDS